MEKKVVFKFSFAGFLRLFLLVIPAKLLELIFAKLLYKIILRTLWRIISYAASFFLRSIRKAIVLREEPAGLTKFFLMVLCVILVMWLWISNTSGKIPEERKVSPLVLPSPGDILQNMPSLIYDRGLLKSIGHSLMRIGGGFLFALLIGVPVGLLCGALKRLEYFFKPITIFLTYEPIAALVALTVAWFGIGEKQKIVFIFVATLGFVIRDVTKAMDNVEQKYIDVSQTLGANKQEIIFRIMSMLALPEIFDRARVTLGLAFSYIIFAELIDAKFGIGKIIYEAQQTGPREHIYAVLFVIAGIAFLLDKAFISIYKRLFPYKQPSA